MLYEVITDRVSRRGGGAVLVWTCRHCGASFRLPAAPLAGRRIRCPRCSTLSRPLPVSAGQPPAGGDLRRSARALGIAALASGVLLLVGVPWGRAMLAPLPTSQAPSYNFV